MSQNPIPVEDSPPAIVFAGTSKSYGDVVALQPLDLRIEDGEFFCLLGPSGCGKTTTLNLLGGFVAPSSGSIYLHGERIDLLPPNRRPVNTVFQSYALFPHMTVRKNVGFGLKMARRPKAEINQRVGQILERVGLEELADRMPSELSGGQQQRVAVARALVNEPRVLLLDEPLGALDLKLRKRLQEELAEIHRSVKTTFVYVTHDQEEAMVLGTRIAVMQGGRLEQVGTPEEIYRRPTSRFVADFIGSANFIPFRFDCGTAMAGKGIVVPVGDAWSNASGRATLVIRPEDVSVTTVASADGHSLRARIGDAVFLGSDTRLTLDVDGVAGSFFALLDRRDARVAMIDRGTEVFVSWPTESAVVVDHEPASGSTQPQEGVDDIDIQRHYA